MRGFARHLLFGLRYWLALVAIMGISPVVAGQRPLSLDDVLAIERLERVSVSPDGALVAAVVRRGALPGEVYGRAAYEIDPSRADTWIIDRATAKKRNITEGHRRSAGAWCATWSPDGQRLAFLSTRPEGAEPAGGDNVRLYVWERGSGKLRRLSDRGVVTQTRYGSGVNRLDIAGPKAAAPDACLPWDENPPFVWLDAQTLLAAFLPAGRVSALLDTSERVYRHVAATREAMRGGATAMTSVSGSGAERTTMAADEVAILSVGKVGTGGWSDVASLPAYPFKGSLGIRVAPDGQHAAVLATTAMLPPQAGVPFAKNDGEWEVEKRLGFVDLAPAQTVRWVDLPVAAHYPVGLSGWGADGRQIGFSARAAPQLAEAANFTADAATGAVSAGPAPAPAAATARPAGLPDGAALLASDTRGLVWSEDTPQGVFLKAAPPGGGPARLLLTLNGFMAGIDMGETRVFDYVGKDGTPLKAMVMLPPGYRDGQRLPVITWVYGGVSGVGWLRESADPTMPGLYNLRLYTAKGYAVLIPSIPIKRDGTEDPLMALALSVDPAVDRLVAMGIADPARVGVMGQSFGGFTALGLASQSKRFRAVVAIASISDLTGVYGAFDPTARDYAGIDHEKADNFSIVERGSFTMQVPPSADPDRYQRNSPLTFVGEVTAPVLLLHGEHDIRGTSYQAEAFFTGLWRQGKTARIVRYWGEDHSMAASPATVRSVVGEILRWFDTWLAPAPAAQ